MLADLTALVLAGGKGRRLRSVVADRPKPMALFHGRPFLEYALEFLRESGVEHIVLCVGYRSEQIRAHFGDGRRWGIRIAYSRETKPLGTAGALRHARRHVPDRFLVLNGDSLFRMDLESLVADHARAARTSSQLLGTIALKEVTDPARFGSVTMQPGGRIIRFEEKSLSRGRSLVNAGIYVMEAAMFALVPEGRPVSLEREVLPRALEAGHELRGHVGTGFFVDIGTPAGHRTFQKRLRTHSP